MNIKLLREVQKRILNEPKQFQMSNWFIFNKDIPNCHTAACICGWVATIASKCKKPSSGAKKMGSHVVNFYCGISGWDTPLRHFAQKKLDITDNEAHRLFKFFCWPEEFVCAYQPGTIEYAINAVARIDHFIATNGAE
jgi:hypothetical protein